MDYSTLPIYKTTQVAVLGGGLAGCAAAVAAARNGAKTLLVESGGCLGGAATAGLVAPISSIYTKSCKQKFGGILWELLDRVTPYAEKYCRADGYPVTALHIYKYVLLQLLKESGAEILFHAFLADVVNKPNGEIDYLVVATKAGLQRVRAAVYIDTTGDGLHKRGYRAEATAAPIRETLAAAMVYLSRRRGDRPLCDPLCGSGTILIEAALMASCTAPGLNRAFAVEGFAGADPADGETLRAEARARIHAFDGPITGSDRDTAAVALAKANAKKAGVGDQITFACADLSAAPFPDSGIVITNPPYGERLGDVAEARAVYAALGRRIFEKRLGAYVISPDEQFEKFFGRRADKKRKLYNGMMKCNVFQYR